MIHWVSVINDSLHRTEVQTTAISSKTNDRRQLGTSKSTLNRITLIVDSNISFIIYAFIPKDEYNNFFTKRWHSDNYDVLQ